MQSVGDVNRLCEFFVSLEGVRLATDGVAAFEWMAARRATPIFVFVVVQVDE